MKTQFLLSLLIPISCIVLGIGLILPCVTLIPKMGDFSVLLEVIAPEILATQQYSILSGIQAMYQEGQIEIALLLFVFSVLFPIWKLIIFWQNKNELSVQEDFKFKAAYHLGKFSMLDVFVIALLILFIKGLPGGSEIKIEPGFYYFVSAVFSSLIISIILYSRKKKNI